MPPKHRQRDAIPPLMHPFRLSNTHDTPGNESVIEHTNTRPVDRRPGVPGKRSLFAGVEEPSPATVNGRGTAFGKSIFSCERSNPPSTGLLGGIFRVKELSLLCKRRALLCIVFYSPMSSDHRNSATAAIPECPSRIESCPQFPHAITRFVRSGRSEASTASLRHGIFLRAHHSQSQPDNSCSPFS